MNVRNRNGSTEAPKVLGPLRRPGNHRHRLAAR